MKVIITGANGQLGNDCTQVLARENEVIALGRRDLDITRADEVNTVIDRRRPDVLVNCAAYTRVDDCETEKELARKVNVSGPQNLAAGVDRIGGHTEKQNIDVVETICDILDETVADKDIGPRRDLVTFVTDRPGHDRRYAIDFSKLKEELGWTPAESFESGIRKTIAWYLSNMQWVQRVQSGEYRTWIKQHKG